MLSSGPGSANDAVLAQVSDDHVEAKTLTPGHGPQRWREWEIELVDGSADILKAADRLLAAARATPSMHHSKLARALGRDPSSPPRPHEGVKRKSAAGDVLLAHLSEQAQAIIKQDPLVRQNAHESIHKMRVATRRMRSVLATYRTLLEDRDQVQAIRNKLKWLAGVLGEARDAEVMHERLKDIIAHEPAELVMGPVPRRVDIELGAAYQTAHGNVLAALNDKRYLQLLDALEALLTEPALTPWPPRQHKKSFPNSSTKK